MREIIIDEKFAECCAIDTESHLKNTLGNEITELFHQFAESIGEEVDGWDTENEHTITRFLNAYAKRHHEFDGNYVSKTRDNTYNGENDFSSQFVWSVWCDDDADDWIYPYGPAFVVVHVHRCGDVRANYGGIRIFEAESFVDNGFLDFTHGWYVTTSNGEVVSDEYSAGYSSHPTSHLMRDIKGELHWSKRHNAFVGWHEPTKRAVKCYVD